MAVSPAVLIGGALLAGAAVAAATPTPKIPDPQKPVAPPQASQAPNVQGVQSGLTGQGQAGGAPGVSQTFLTGAGGVDPNSLNLGKTTLLGG